MVSVWEGCVALRFVAVDAWVLRGLALFPQRVWRLASVHFGSITWRTYVEGFLLFVVERLWLKIRSGLVVVTVDYEAVIQVGSELEAEDGQKTASHSYLLYLV